MNNKEFLRRMDNLSRAGSNPKAMLAAAQLMKEAYEKDLSIPISCTVRDKKEGILSQTYINVEGKNRYLLCFTDPRNAKYLPPQTFPLAVSQQKVRDIMNNMFNKEVIIGLLFNPYTDNMLIISKAVMQELMPGDHPLPPNFQDAE